MKRYEGLFILNAAAHDETLTKMIDRITAEIEAAGGKVEKTQKMEKRAFARVAEKKHSAGFYVNIIFSGASSTVATLRNRITPDEEVFRIMFTEAPATEPVAEVKQ